MAEGYICAKCEQNVDLNPIDGKVICPECSHRVLFKKRPEDPNELKAV
jgi:DNA-directed RNA polymerase subunit RPC12/RpoP